MAASKESLPKVGSRIRPHYRAGQVVFASFIINTISGGLRATSGLYLDYFLHLFGSSRAAITGGLALQASLNYLSGVAVGPLNVRFGNLKVAAVGAILSSVGLFLNYFTSHLAFLYIFFAIFTGIGGGMTAISSASSVQEHTDKFRALGAGLAVSGYGVGYFIWPQIVRWAIEEYGARGSFFILSGVMLHTVPCALLLQPSVANRKLSRDDAQSKSGLNQSEKGSIHIANEEEDGRMYMQVRKDCDNAGTAPYIRNGKHPVKLTRTNTFTCPSLWRRCSFLLPEGTSDSNCAGFTLPMMLCIASYTCFMAGNLSVHIYAPAKALSMGFTLGEAAKLMSMVGIGSLTGRIVAAFIGFFHWSLPTSIYISANIVCGACVVMINACDAYWKMLVCLLLFGLISGMSASMHSTAFRDLVGIEDFALIYGYCCAGGGIGNLVWTYLTAYLWEVTQQLSAPLVMAGGIIVVSGIILSPVLASECKKRGCVNKC